MSQLTSKEERVHVGAFVPREQRDRLFELAARRDRSVSSIVRLALQAELERDREQAKWSSYTAPASSALFLCQSPLGRNGASSIGRSRPRPSSASCLKFPAIVSISSAIRSAATRASRSS